LLYNDLNRIITDYETLVHWEGKQVQEIKMASNPWKMATDQKYLYICMSTENIVARYTVDTLQLVDQFITGRRPRAIDISSNELYVCEGNGPVKVFDIRTKEIIRQWRPSESSAINRTIAIKIHGGNLYYASYSWNQICVFNLSGGLIKDFGTRGSNPGQFRDPYGIDVDDQFIYVADCGNSRIQVFHLLSCTYSHQWGSGENFTYPCEIRVYKGLCCVGDKNGVQVFTENGLYLCRYGKSLFGSGTGEFWNVRGILAIGSRLYVSDFGNKRLVVLQ